MTTQDFGDAHRLTALLGVMHSVDTIDEAAWTVAEWVAETFEAEVASVLVGGETVASLGRVDPEAHQHVDAAPILGVDGGAIVVGRLDGDDLQPAELNLLRGVARVAGLVLRLLQARDAEAKLAEDVVQRNRLIEAVLEIQRAISRGENVQAVLDSVVDAVGEVLGPDYSVGLQLVDAHDPTTSSIVASRNVPAGVVEQFRHVPIDEGWAGAAIRRRELIVRSRSGAGGLVPELRLLGVEALMIAPIVASDRVLGAVAVAQTEEGPGFTKVQVETLEALANQAALALADAQAEQRLRDALVDDLTGLPNRTLLMDRVEQALARGRRDGVPSSLIFIDLDKFKMVNDSLGHAAGDQLLQVAAQRLQGSLREVDTCARLGGDEFAILLPGSDATGADRIARRSLTALRRPFEIEGRVFTIGASLGIAEAGPDTTPSDLIRNADLAMYEAKRGQTGSVRRFAPIMHAAALHALELRTDLEKAINEGGLRLAYQPLFDLGTKDVVGAEALIRWEHPTRGNIPPADFIPLAEDTGLIIGIGHFVLEQALADLARWRRESDRDLYVTINVSPAQFLDPMFVPSIEAALRIHRVPADRLVVEITETSLMSDVGPSVERAAQLRRRGVKLAIDDFGTGYSSLTYLRTFDFDVLKMDRGFIAESTPDAEDLALVRTIVDMCASLQIQAVAEGIEHEWQQSSMAELGCDLGQGFHLGRPVDEETFRTTWVAKEQATTESR